MAKAAQVTLNDWEQQWTDNKAGWHEAEGNHIVRQHFDRIVEESFPNKEAKDMKIFVPLCGKSKDMYLFYKRGFTVVGIEFAGQPIREFFEENNLETKEKDSNSPFTESADGRLMIGEGDLFSFTMESGNIKSLPQTTYDIIWDRGSFEAMNVSDRQKYHDFIMPLFNRSGIYFISVPEYNKEEYGGPPNHATKEDLETMFGDQLAVSLISSKDAMPEATPEREVWRAKGLSAMSFNCYIMTSHSGADQ